MQPPVEVISIHFLVLVAVATAAIHVAVVPATQFSNVMTKVIDMMGFVITRKRSVLRIL
jgi:hypothetical protein